MKNFYNAFIDDGILTGVGINTTKDNSLNVPITEEEYNLAVEKGVNYFYFLNDELILNPKYEEELEQQKRERIAMLKLTKREVFLGLYQAKGVTPDIIKAQITDPQALIEFEYANDYYRGNPLIDIVGATLGITPEQLDCFFETKDYTCLLPVEEEEVIDDTNNSTTTDDTDVPVQPQIEDGLQEGETTDS